MTVSHPNTLYFDWETYQDGEWLDFDKTTKPAMKEFLECFAGRRIGNGTTRMVFECKFDPSFVIKVSRPYTTQNAVEYSVWEKYKDYPRVSKWLSPVLSISSSGRVIVQKRTLPLLKPPKLIPEFLTDLKVQNFGILDGRLVAHDYGLGIFVDGEEKVKMVRPTWWDGGTQKDYD